MLYYVALKYRPDGPGPGCRCGVRRTPDRLLSAYGLDPRSDMDGELDVRALAPEFTVGPFTVTTTRMQHPVESYAIQRPPVAVASPTPGTPDPPHAWPSWPRGTDLALFEASFVSDGDNPPDLHLTGAEAAGWPVGQGAARVPADPSGPVE